MNPNWRSFLESAEGVFDGDLPKFFTLAMPPPN
jgi:hypothetical protein